MGEGGRGEVEVGGGGSLVAQTLGRLNLETRDLVFFVCVCFLSHSTTVPHWVNNASI